MTKIRAVIFDWAGTMVDFGSFAPMGAFVEVFGEFGISITTEQARAPMGMAKWDHIKTLLEMPDVKRQYEVLFGKAPTDKDVDRIFDVFVPMNEKVAGKYADLVPGAIEMLAFLKDRNIRVGSTTGYTRSIMEHVIPVAASQGYSPEIVVCSDEVSHGRPAPHAMRKCFEALDIVDPTSVIKVDDTEPGIGEGVAAGCITVGLSLSGNHAGKTPSELAAMPEDDVNDIRQRASKSLREAGADHVIDSVSKLPALIDQIDS